MRFLTFPVLAAIVLVAGASEPWRTVVAVGTEISDGDHSFLMRVGGSYEIGFNGWSLSPEVNLDFVDGDTVLVFGASFVRKF